MWLDQYKKTFVGMQVTIAIFTAAMYLGLYRQVSAAVGFFVIMQAGAIAGAYWGSKLKNRLRNSP
jgi:uncharacterized membrane protein YfcA